MSTVSVVESFSEIQQIYRGSFADVYKVKARIREGTDTVYDRIITAEFLNLCGQCTDSELQQLLDQNIGLRSLRHENLVNILDVQIQFDQNTIAFFMDLFEGRNLRKFIDEHPSRALEGADIKHISKQICNALEYLHSNSVIHRNINSGTVIIGEDTLVKLVDFGLSIELMDATSHHSIGGNPRGHPQYMAPEVFLVEETADAACIYSRGSDIWAFGCVVYEMASGMKPYAECKNMLAIVRRAKDDKPTELPTECSDALKHFYAGCMVGARHERTSAADLLKHEFLVGSQ